MVVFVENKQGFAKNPAGWQCEDKRHGDCSESTKKVEERILKNETSVETSAACYAGVVYDAVLPDPACGGGGG